MTSAQLSVLRAYFTGKGIQQAHIAQQTNVTPARVSQLLSGARAFGKSTAHQWQTLYGISAAWLLTGEGDMVAGETSTAWLRELEAQRQLTAEAQRQSAELIDIIKQLTKGK